MSAKTEQIIRRLASSIRDTDKRKTSAYDTTATVRRIEGSTAWVHIPGGVDETPVKLTINAQPGDDVQVRVSGGRAFLVGNGTAPPTDDTTANNAVRQINTVNKIVSAVKAVAERAAKIAANTNQYFWMTETGNDTGAHITEVPQDEFLADPDNGGGNLLARSNGIAVRDGLTELAQFSAEGLDVYGVANGVQQEIAHLGYGDTWSSTQQTNVLGRYYTIGTRDTDEHVGWQTYSIGDNNAVTGGQSVAIGLDNVVSGWYSTAIGQKITSRYDRQVILGLCCNSGEPFAVGVSGSSSNPATDFYIDSDGNATFSGDVTIAGDTTFSGNATFSGDVTPGSDQWTMSSVETVIESLSSGVWAEEIMFSAPADGTYLVIYGAAFSTNATGYRQLHLGTMNSSSAGRYSPSYAAVSGDQTRINACKIVTTTMGTEWNIYLRQNSGSTLKAYLYAQYVRIL